MASDPSVRTLLYTREIAGELDPNSWRDPDLGRRYAGLAADFDRFVTGDMIEVGLSPYEKGEGAFMARLDPVDFGLWSIRSRAPLPSIRVFGGFAMVDTFVALRTDLREDLDGPGGPKWKRAIGAADAMWLANFDRHKPLISEMPHDYLSDKVLAV